MITDLLRNDLGQVCEFGSVGGPEMLQLESLAQVHHLVSTVTGTLRPDTDAIAALAACFPGGSITGAPKKRAMEIIRELEGGPRGIYCGAIGWLGYNGESSFNIAIRTLVREGGRLVYQVGAGIVADSDPQQRIRGNPAQSRRHPAGRGAVDRGIPDAGALSDRTTFTKAAGRASQAVASRGRQVRISGSPAVTSTVCSKWAEGLRSSVMTVHPSSRIRTDGIPALTIGSMASVMPGMSVGVFPCGR